MRIRNNARNGLLISITILGAALLMIILEIRIFNVDTNLLNPTDKLKYYLSNIHESENSVWRTVYNSIIGVLVVLSAIISFVMCRCHSCRKHIHFMNIFTMYCPYCGKSLDANK